MIDYEKLKLAHEIASKLKDEDDYMPLIKHIFRCDHNELEDAYMETTLDYKGHYVFESIDALITKLKDLTPESKYKVGQTVWFKNGDDEPDSVRIDAIDESPRLDDPGLEEHQMYLDQDEDWWAEYQLYPTREALIEAQIKHWQSLLAETKKYYDGFGHCGKSYK